MIACVSFIPRVFISGLSVPLYFLTIFSEKRQLLKSEQGNLRFDCSIHAQVNHGWLTPDTRGVFLAIKT